MSEVAVGPAQAVAAILLALGALLMFLSSVGLIRMPDLYTRMSASSKAAGLGSSLVLAAVAFHFGTLAVTTRAVAAIVFIFLTVPVAAHMVARAGYMARVPIWDRTIQDDLAGRYDRDAGVLESDEDQP
ncbi:MAG: monovalent cation/H(+) antiporter subunit G [Thermoplasmatota archaeon]